MNFKTKNYYIEKVKETFGMIFVSVVMVGLLMFMVTFA